MLRRSSLDTLRAIRERTQYVRRAALGEALRRERVAARQYRDSVEALQSIAEQSEKSGKLARTRLSGTGLSGSEGQQWDAWRRQVRGNTLALTERCKTATSAWHFAQSETRDAQQALGKASVGLKQLKRRLVQQKQAEWLRRDSSDHDTQDDCTLHRIVRNASQRDSLRSLNRSSNPSLNQAQRRRLATTV